MRILHICLSSFYIDNYNYQENALPRVNKEDGHKVRILASTESYLDNAHTGFLEPKEYVTEYGVPIKRLPYVKIGPHSLTIKFRKYPHVYEEIAAFAPDVILCHGLSFWSVLDVIRYKKDHPQVKLYADTHTDAGNSGTNWLSLHVLHLIFYRFLIQKALPYLEKYFYISEEGRLFSVRNYGVPEDIMEFYPLGGTLLPEEEYQVIRTKCRTELGLGKDELLLIHSGKLVSLKRTDELLRAFSSVPKLRARLVVIGSIPDEQKELLSPLMEADSRIIYLGWKAGEELQEYLCACDLYCQPGSESITAQNAICRNCPLLLYPHESYLKDYEWGNVFWVKSEADMVGVFRRLAENPAVLAPMEENSRRCAQKLLDYRILAARLYQ